MLYCFMTYGYSTDLRKRVLKTYDKGGMTQKAVCQMFNISIRALGSWLKLRRDTGDAYLRKRPPVRTSRKIYQQELEQYLRDRPDDFLWEIAKHFKCSAPSVFAACKKFGITRKKNDPLRREIGRKKTSIPQGNSNAKS
ncbi:transposase [Alphaproteobacteria bacterium]|nr:transposase [Alphaproteobacteria bacterium]